MSRKFFTQPSRVHQSFKSEADINNIIRKHRTTGVVDYVNRSLPSYSDVSSFTDYHSSLQVVSRAEDAFFKLPAKVREEFSNSPGYLLAFLENPANRDRAIDLGLIEKPVVPPVKEVISDAKA